MNNDTHYTVDCAVDCPDVGWGRSGPLRQEAGASRLRWRTADTESGVAAGLSMILSLLGISGLTAALPFDSALSVDFVPPCLKQKFLSWTRYGY